MSPRDVCLCFWLCLCFWISLFFSLALEKGQRHLTVRHQDFSAVLDLEARVQLAAKASVPLASRMRPLFQYRDPATGQWQVAAAHEAVPARAEAFVLPLPSGIGGGRPSEEVLGLLVEEGVVDPSQWAPPCTTPTALGLGGAPETSPLVTAALERYLAPALEDSTAYVEQLGFAGRRGSTWDEAARRAEAAAADRGRGGTGLGGRLMDGLLEQATDAGVGARGARETGLGGRLMDGLGEAAPGPGGAVAFYDAGYWPPVGPVAFCLQLPQNGEGYVYARGSVLRMCGDAVLKTQVGPCASCRVRGMDVGRGGGGGVTGTWRT